jgi:uncharacterized membrane protein YbhN (UPF0104 family)
VSRRRPIGKLLLAAVVSLGLLALLYGRVDRAQLLSAVRQASLPLLLLALSMGGVLSSLTSWRYTHFARRLAIEPAPPFTTALKSYFLAASLNLFLPSKLGDLGKGLLCSRLDRLAYPFELHVFTLYEKVADLFALVTLGAAIGLLRPLDGGAGIPNPATSWGGVGLAPLLLLLAVPLWITLVPHRRHGVLAALLKKAPRKLREAGMIASRFHPADFLAFLGVSLLLWALHLLQAVLFAQALGMALWTPSGLFVVVTAILVGLLPISFAGIGTRDATLLLLLGGLYGPARPLLFGVLLTSRYVVPALVGCLFLGELGPAPRVPGPPAVDA